MLSTLRQAQHHVDCLGEIISINHFNISAFTIWSKATNPHSCVWHTLDRPVCRLQINKLGLWFKFRLKVVVIALLKTLTPLLLLPIDSLLQAPNVLYNHLAAVPTLIAYMFIKRRMLLWNISEQCCVICGSGVPVNSFSVSVSLSDRTEPPIIYELAIKQLDLLPSGCGSWTRASYYEMITSSSCLSDGLWKF